ncbi:YceI family protein [Roseobacter sp.]|uniref:YceI family protein n=1 Tax=Roseobacter sp. TaxID=1907202 RepID=UPI003298662C
MPISFSRRSLIASGLAGWATAGLAAARDYDLTPDHARVAFIFDVTGASQTGTVPIVQADIRVNTQDLTRSSADVSADVRRAQTGFVFSTQALLSRAVLDADTHPTVRFRSTRITLGRDSRISNGARIEGALTLRGVTRPLTLDATLTRPTGSAPDDLSVLNIQLTGLLSRSAYGASGYPNMVADAVRLEISAEIQQR